MFGKRTDATLVSDLSRMRRFMPYVSPRRNDSAFLMRQDVGADAALEFLEKKNAERPEDRPITLFHLFLRAASLALLERPGVNRFVKGGKLWQRDGEWISFSAKEAIRDGSPMFTIKRRFYADVESLDEMVDGIYDLLIARRAGRESRSEKEIRWALLLPGFVIRAAVLALRLGDHLGILPRKFIDPDPLFSSVFLANLGSIDYPAGFHHLWEYGTTSIFGVMGRVERSTDGRRKLQLAWTYDERIEDGLYSYHTLELIRERIENPERLQEKPRRSDVR